MTTIGTDPEFMLIKDNKIYSAINIIKNNKDKRKKVKNYYFYHDNVLAECTIPPASTKETFIQNIKTGLITIMIRNVFMHADMNILHNFLIRLHKYKH